ncbi:MAG: hypothetical protein GF315_10975 [candidate division Zixibacteria bacterium]|nr:hypothetical protein [candidate division Zixibacteria bacterium]
MKYHHLTDEEFQLYLDKQHEIDTERIRVHIDECEYCRNQLTQYKNLYAQLGKDPDYSLSDISIDSVMEKIGSSNLSKYRQIGPELLVSIFSVFASIACALYFLDIRSVIPGLIRLHKSQTELLRNSFDFVGNLIKGVNLEINSLAMAAIILSIIMLFDLLLSEKISRIRSKR